MPRFFKYAKLLFADDGDFDISCVGGNFASAARDGIGNADPPGVGVCYEYHVAQQAARDISRVCFDEKLVGVALLKRDVPRASLDRNRFFDDYTVQENIAGAAA